MLKADSAPLAAKRQVMPNRPKRIRAQNPGGQYEVQAGIACCHIKKPVQLLHIGRHEIAQRGKILVDCRFIEVVLRGRCVQGVNKFPFESCREDVASIVRWKS